jgi:hypothetical protein
LELPVRVPKAVTSVGWEIARYCGSNDAIFVFRRPGSCASREILHWGRQWLIGCARREIVPRDVVSPLPLQTRIHTNDKSPHPFLSPRIEETHQIPRLDTQTQNILTGLNSTKIDLTACYRRTKTKLRGFGPRSNYTDRATAACWRS